MKKELRIGFLKAWIFIRFDNFGKINSLTQFIDSTVSLNLRTIECYLFAKHIIHSNSGIDLSKTMKKRL